MLGNREFRDPKYDCIDDAVKLQIIDIVIGSPIWKTYIAEKHPMWHKNGVHAQYVKTVLYSFDTYIKMRGDFCDKEN